MNRPSAIAVASITAILFAGAASLSVHSYLKRQADKGFRGVAIAAAATDIPIGTKLDGGMVKLVNWPKESLPAGYYPSTGAVVGRVAVRPLVAGDLVTEQKLMPVKGTGSGVMSYLVPPGHRAVTVAVNEVAGVAGFITPQSRVDVVLTTPQPGTTDKENNISKVILQNVPVLASGQITQEKDGKPAVLPTATLDLEPADAEKLIVGAKTGTLQLLLRNVVDSAPVETRGATIPKALGVAERPAPPAAKPAHKVSQIRKTEVKRVAKVEPRVAPPAPPAFNMEIIRGGTKSRGAFPDE